MFYCIKGRAQIEQGHNDTLSFIYRNKDFAFNSENSGLNAMVGTVCRLKRFSQLGVVHKQGKLSSNCSLNNFRDET